MTGLGCRVNDHAVVWTQGLVVLSLLASMGPVATPALGAVLADWRFAEASSGQVDPAFPHKSDFNVEPGAPLAPSVDSSGHLGRDLLRHRPDIGTLNYRNQVNYENLSAAVANKGFTGPATYYRPYALADGRGIFSGHDGTDVLSARDPNAFLYSQMSGGFTLELIWRPQIGGLGLNAVTGEPANGANRVLMSIENFVTIGMVDNDPTAGVDSRLYFYTNATLGAPTLFVPLGGLSFINNPSHFELIVAIYDPAGGGQLRLYRDGVLVGSIASTLSNFDANNLNPLSVAQVTTVGGQPNGSNPASSFAFFDHVRVSTGTLDQHQLWLISLPEPASAWMLASAATMLLRRRS